MPHRYAMRLLQMRGQMSTTKRRRHVSDDRRGVIQDGSHTETVLAVITDASPRSLSRREIVTLSQCPAKSVDWALHYLRSIKKIRCHSALDTRSSLYLRYELIVGEVADG